MLQSFIGTFDDRGVQSLRLEEGESNRDINSLCRFWAVLDSNFVPQIHRAITTGDRSGALKLISDCSFSMGTILPD